MSSSNVLQTLLTSMTNGGQRKSRRKASDKRPRVELPGNDRLESDFAAEIGEILAKRDIFARDSLVVILNLQAHRLEPISPTAFRTWVEQYLVCVKPRTDPETGLTVEIEHTMTKEHAATILESPYFKKHLRPLDRVNSLSLPAYDKDGNLHLLTPGYDPATASYTFPA